MLYGLVYFNLVIIELKMARRIGPKDFPLLVQKLTLTKWLEENIILFFNRYNNISFFFSFYGPKFFRKINLNLRKIFLKLKVVNIDLY